jgi:hypothetical protein
LEFHLNNIVAATHFKFMRMWTIYSP